MSLWNLFEFWINKIKLSNTVLIDIKLFSCLFFRWSFYPKGWTCRNQIITLFSFYEIWSSLHYYHIIYAGSVLHFMLVVTTLCEVVGITDSYSIICFILNMVITIKYLCFKVYHSHYIFPMTFSFNSLKARTVYKLCFNTLFSFSSLIISKFYSWRIVIFILMIWNPH